MTAVTIITILYNCNVMETPQLLLEVTRVLEQVVDVVATITVSTGGAVTVWPVVTQK